MKTTFLCFQIVIFLLADIGYGEKLLVILLDGFRWDFRAKYGPDLPGFKRLAENGVEAEYLIPPFPSVTYTSLYSIVTGLHPESHGMVGNNMWDEKEDETFDFGFNPEQIHPHWWDGGEPVWITATRQDKVAHVYEWLGCEVEIRGRRPAYCDVYGGFPTDFEAAKKTFVNQLRTALDGLQNGTDVVLIYFELSDFLGHLFGPDSPEVRQMVQWIDVQIDRLLDEISERGMKNELNFLLLSDHGMTDISESRVIDITKGLDETEYERIMDHGPITNVWPKPGLEKKVYDKLRTLSPHMTVYLKQKLPDRWRRKNHFRVAPITCVANTGWMILKSDGIPGNGGKKYSGYHGYDNNEVDMRSIFYAIGPNIRAGLQVKAFENVHVYQLMCRILQIEPAPNNGTWVKVKDIYQERSYLVLTVWSYFTVIVTLALIALCVNRSLNGHFKSKES